MWRGSGATALAAGSATAPAGVALHSCRGQHVTAAAVPSLAALNAAFQSVNFRVNFWKLGGSVRCGFRPELWQSPRIRRKVPNMPPRTRSAATKAEAVADDSGFGLPKWLDDMLKPGVGSGLLTASY